MATLKDIAQLASISNRNCIPCPQSRSESICHRKTRHRILTVAEELGYQTSQSW